MNCSVLSLSCAGIRITDNCVNRHFINQGRIFDLNLRGVQKFQRGGHFGNFSSLLRYFFDIKNDLKMGCTQLCLKLWGYFIMILMTI